MMAVTILIGNGLGMALDPKHFKLRSGLDSAFSKLNCREKKIITSMGRNIPDCEGGLEKYHEVATSCGFLAKYKHKKNFLNRKGRKFSSIYQNFIYLTAKHFFEYKLEDNAGAFNIFLNNMISLINNETTYIASLNYDKLLYERFCADKICSGYRGKLVDGMVGDGFTEENLLPKYDNRFGWYLHLHGSPLFYRKDDRFLKSNINDLPDRFDDGEKVHDHIVLAPTNLKPSEIAKSKILEIYFDFFQVALQKSEKIVIFGYSGLDNHMNLAIKRRVDLGSEPCVIEVVEWSESCDGLNATARENFWRQKLGIKESSSSSSDSVERCRFTLKPMDNILLYDFTKGQ